MARYELQGDLQYAAGGEMHKASFIEMQPPRYPDMTNFMVVKQAFISAATSIKTDGAPAPEASSGEAPEISGKDAVDLMYAMGTNMSQVFTAVQELLRASALVDGETKVTLPLLQKLSVEDSEGLMGCYVANFIAPSLMGGA